MSCRFESDFRHQISIHAFAWVLISPSFSLVNFMMDESVVICILLLMLHSRVIIHQYPSRRWIALHRQKHLYYIRKAQQCEQSSLLTLASFLSVYSGLIIRYMITTLTFWCRCCYTGDVWAKDTSKPYIQYKEFY